MCIVAMPNTAPCLLERDRSLIRLFDKKTGNMNKECCGSREKGQANGILATLVAVSAISKTCAHLQTMTKTSVKYQNNWH